VFFVEKDCEVIIKFLERVKEGEYAPIEESSLPYARMNEKRIIIEEEDNYYYGIS
jgi:hypothetical protein